MTSVVSAPTVFTPARVLAWVARGGLGLIVLIPVAIAIHAGLYDSFVGNALSGWGMWGTFVIHMATRPRRKEIVVTVFLGLAMRLLYDVAIGEKGYPGYVLLAMGTFLGLASLTVLAVQAMRMGVERRASTRRALAVIALFNYIGVCLSFYLSFATMALPRKLDYFLYSFDGLFGVQPSFALGKLMPAYPPLGWLAIMVYNSLGLWFCVLYAVHARVYGKYRFNIIRMFVANAFIGVSLYFIFPAMGPKYAFPSFPNLPAAVAAASVLIKGRPNAMPSLHFAGTLLLFCISRPWKWVRVGIGSIAVLTVIATMGTGEHYMVDLVVAFPYTLAILAIASDVPERRLPLLVGTAMVFAWFGALRIGGIPPVVAWMMVGVTLITCFRLERKLALSLWAPDRHWKRETRQFPERRADAA